MANILVVDDELGIRDLLSEILNDEGHQVELAENAAQAREARQKAEFDLVLLDIWMPDTDGVSLLTEWAASATLTMPVIMMSGHATIETAVEATRIGAFSFLEKPITLQKLLKAVEQALARGLMRKAVSVAASSAASLFASPAPPAPALAAVAPAWEGTAPTPMGAPEPVVAPVAPAPVVPNWVHFELPLREARDSFEKAYFEYHLEQEHGSMTRVADKTGLERTHLYRKLRQLGVDLGRTKKA